MMTFMLGLWIGAAAGALIGGFCASLKRERVKAPDRRPPVRSTIFYP